MESAARSATMSRMTPRRRSAVALFAVLALVAAACSSGGDAEQADQTEPTPTATPRPATTSEAVAGDETQPTPTSTPAEPTPTPDEATPTPTPAATPTPLPSPTPQPMPTPTPEPPESVATEPCAAGLAGTPVAASTAPADVDGDGALDQVTVYGTGSAASPAPWRIRVDFASGEATDSPIAIDPNAAGIPIGGADVDGDGSTDEVFVAVGAGASAVIVAIYTLVGCDMMQATNGGAPIGFPIGGSVQNLGGLQCIDTDRNGVNNTIVAWLATAVGDTGDGTYAIEGVEYRLRGTELSEVGVRTLQANVSEADFVYANLTCGGVSL